MRFLLLWAIGTARQILLCAGHSCFCTGEMAHNAAIVHLVLPVVVDVLVAVVVVFELFIINHVDSFLISAAGSHQD